RRERRNGLVRETAHGDAQHNVSVIANGWCFLLVAKRRNAAAVRDGPQDDRWLEIHVLIRSLAAHTPDRCEPPAASTVIATAQHDRRPTLIATPRSPYED